MKTNTTQPRAITPMAHSIPTRVSDMPILPWCLAPQIANLLRGRGQLRTNKGYNILVVRLNQEHQGLPIMGCSGGLVGLYARFGSKMDQFVGTGPAPFTSLPMPALDQTSHRHNVKFFHHFLALEPERNFNRGCNGCTQSEGSRWPAIKYCNPVDEN